jgi:hypothetical protein
VRLGHVVRLLDRTSQDNDNALIDERRIDSDADCIADVGRAVVLGRACGSHCASHDDRL